MELTKNKLLDELKLAVHKHGADKVDIALNIEEGIMYGIYHSKNNSFVLTDEYKVSNKNCKLEKWITKEANKLNIGYSIL